MNDAVIEALVRLNFGWQLTVRDASPRLIESLRRVNEKHRGTLRRLCLDEVTAISERLGLYE